MIDSSEPGWLLRRLSELETSLAEFGGRRTDLGEKSAEFEDAAGIKGTSLAFGAVSLSEMEF